MDVVNDVSLLLEPAFIAKFQGFTRPGKFECIEWRGAKNRGYGQLRVDGTTLVAHRIAWIIHHQQPIPIGMYIDHLCCNKGCVNPLHLECVTQVENSKRNHYGVPGWHRIGPKWGPRKRQDGVTCYPRKNGANDG